jgi:fructokinase
VRGVLSEDKTALEHDVMLNDWIDFPLQSELKKVTGSDVRLENDAVLAGLGEAIFGSGKDVEVIVYHDISTGVGGAKIVSGKITEESIGIEPGHQILDIDRTILGEDIVPTLENLVSGRAVEERMGVKPADIQTDDVIWNELAGYLAQGLRNSILYWAPEMIILGGSMMTGTPCIPLDVVRKQTVIVLGDVTDSPFITLSTLKTEAGLYGALALGTQIK